MADGCTRCAALEAENARLHTEIDRLQAEIKKLWAYIVWLQGILRAVLRYTSAVIAQSNQVLSEHQARGKWAYHKAAKEVAENVTALIRG